MTRDFGLCSRLYKGFILFQTNVFSLLQQHTRYSEIMNFKMGNQIKIYYFNGSFPLGYSNYFEMNYLNNHLDHNAFLIKTIKSE